MAFGEVVVTQMPSQHRMTDWLSCELVTSSSPRDHAS